MLIKPNDEFANAVAELVICTVSDPGLLVAL
jgi:hypothetical protein